MRAELRLLAVDLDGTLVDSAPDLAFAVDAALVSIGLQPAGERRVRGWIGDGIEILMERALAAAGADRGTLLEPALAEFAKTYAARVFVRSRVYEGVPETLETIEARGIRLVCITNKRERFARAVLEQAGLLERFDRVLGGDSLPAKKPDPLPLTTAARDLGVAVTAAAMVGDSHHDLRAAAAAGFAFYWASYGYCADPGAPGPIEFRKLEAFSDLTAFIGTSDAR